MIRTIEQYAAQAPALTEIEMLRRRCSELEYNIANWGIIEIASRNPSVAEYMRYWEGRALKAEGILLDRERSALRLSR